MKNNNEKIEAAFMLQSYFDTIGFFNSNWELNYGRDINNIESALVVNMLIISHFMSLGGFNYFKINNLIASDDTILMIIIIESLLNGSNEINFIDAFIKYHNNLLDKSRVAGIQTLKSILFLKKIKQKNLKSYLSSIPMDIHMGGNGAAIRTGPIGILYSDNLDKLLSVSIISSRLTHNIPMGYLGGFISALFASYAFKNIQPFLWIDLLLDIYESKTIHKYINSTDIGKKHDEEIEEYFLGWYKYKEERLYDLINFRNKSKFIFQSDRYDDLYNYIPNKYIKNKDEKKIYWSLIGASGFDSILYAYDSLMMSIIYNNDFKLNLDNPIYNFENVLFYSTLHIGDSDSTGAIVGFWYGALLGYNGINSERMKELEFYDKLKKLSKKFENFIK